MVLVVGAQVLHDEMRGNTDFWVVTGLVADALGIGTGWWVRRRVPVAPAGDDRR